ncbi:MAG: hypothetical protein QXJ50_04825 [Candidatus Woesearchaeota archaeon]
MKGVKFVEGDKKVSDADLLLREVEDEIMGLRALTGIYKESAAQVLNGGSYLNAERAIVVRERILEESLSLRDLLISFLKKERV